jgi:ring-1,2-phenylacetyl-CoA epoxidase subunit PaaC
VTPEARAALERYVMAMADDELVIGYRDTEWTGAAPLLEEDLAFSSIGVDEVGHARTCYALLHDLTGQAIDYRARRPDEYRHAHLLELAAAPRYEPSGEHRANRGWAFAIVRQWFYDEFDALRLESLAASAWQPLAQAVEKVRREEKYHLLHTRTWLERLADSTATQPRLVAALRECCADASGMFEPVDGEATLVEQGVVACTSAELRSRWQSEIAARLAAFAFTLPRLGAGGLGGRRGEHGPEWAQLWDEMTSVYRLDPAATW